jgi:hypothetical protein
MRRVAIAALFAFLTAPAVRPQGLEGLVNLQFQLDARVFAVMAAARAAGLEVEAGEGGAGRIQQQVGSQLEQLDPSLRSRLREFHGVRQAAASAYVSLALFLGPAPRFELRATVDELPAEVQGLVGFERLTAEVWEHAGLNDLWERLRPEYVRAVDGYRPAIRTVMLEVLRYLRTTPRVALDRQVTFIPDLLNGAGVVNARNIGQDYMLLVGPERAGRRPLASVRHEYLHFMVDPLVRKYEQYLPEPEPFLKVVRGRRAPRVGFGDDFPLVVSESLIRALELRLDHAAPAEELAEMAEGFEQGLVLLPYFLARLHEFEPGTGSLQEEFERLARGIRWETEKGRADSIARSAAERDARRAGEPAAPAGTGAAVRERLVRANAHLTAREYDQARPVLEEVLRDAPDNPNALLGLAQVAAAAQQLDRALELYGRAIEHAGADQWIAAWAHVRRGSIFRFQGDDARARAEWEKAGALAGDLRGAREAAARALSEAGARP